MDRQVKQDNLQSLEQRHLQEMYNERRMRIQSQKRSLKKAWSSNTDFLEQLKSSTPDLHEPQTGKRKKRKKSTKPMGRKA